ncbi:MAG: YccF domain-containing protein, partial [Chloroflexi bacterium]|nr:YccF domain-containing protein [Chloroflexota bacterium]
LGWWLSFLWTYMAYILALTIIGLPLSFAMFHVIGFVTTLRRN